MNILGLLLKEVRELRSDLREIQKSQKRIEAQQGTLSDQQAAVGKEVAAQASAIADLQATAATQNALLEKIDGELQPPKPGPPVEIELVAGTPIDNPVE